MKAFAAVKLKGRGRHVYIFVAKLLKALRNPGLPTWKPEQLFESMSLMPVRSGIARGLLPERLGPSMFFGLMGLSPG